MSVPEEIRKVPRPRNTVVVDTGLKSDKRFAVLERKQSVCTKGKNPSPRNGRTIGHIADGKFVPSDIKKTEPEEEILSYGSSALIHSLSKDIYSDLLHAFPDDAESIMAMAAVKVINPSVKSDRIAEKYKASFLSRYYPGAGLSLNTVTGILKDIGKAYDGIIKFCGLRTARVPEDHHIIIDKVLKDDDGPINSLSDFRNKTKTTDKRITAVYAYDLELLEPVGMFALPDKREYTELYTDFAKEFNITRGILITDEYFRIKKLKQKPGDGSNLPYILSLKSDDARIRNNNSMLDFQNILKKTDGDILYNREKTKDGKYLYSFMDTQKADLESYDYIEKCMKEYGGKLLGYAEKEKTCGVSAFMSDCDISPLTVYQAYNTRWLMQEFIRRYRSGINIHADDTELRFLIFGAEFINLIASIITAKIIRIFNEKKMLVNDTYGDLMDDLGLLRRSTKADLSAKPLSDDKYWVSAAKAQIEEMTALGLVETPYYEQPKRKPGRPKKAGKTDEDSAL